MSTENTINASAEDFNAAINNLKNCQQEFETAYLRMSNSVRKMGAAWNGAASDSFEAQFNLLYASLETSATSIDNAIKDANFALAAYAETEDDISNVFSAIAEPEDPPFGAG